MDVLVKDYYYYYYLLIIITLISTVKCSLPTWCLYIVLLLFQVQLVHRHQQDGIEVLHLKFHIEMIGSIRGTRICKNLTFSNRLKFRLFPHVRWNRRKLWNFQKVSNKRNPIHHRIGIGKGSRKPQIFHPKYSQLSIKMKFSKMQKIVFCNLKEK